MRCVTSDAPFQASSALALFRFRDSLLHCRADDPSAYDASRITHQQVCIEMHSWQRA